MSRTFTDRDGVTWTVQWAQGATGLGELSARARHRGLLFSASGVRALYPSEAILVPSAHDDEALQKMLDTALGSR